MCGILIDLRIRRRIGLIASSLGCVLVLSVFYLSPSLVLGNLAEKMSGIWLATPPVLSLGLIYLGRRTYAEFTDAGLTVSIIDLLTRTCFFLGQLQADDPLWAFGFLLSPPISVGVGIIVFAFRFIAKRIRAR